MAHKRIQLQKIMSIISLSYIGQAKQGTKHTKILTCRGHAHRIVQHENCSSKQYNNFTRPRIIACFLHLGVWGRSLSFRGERWCGVLVCIVGYMVMVASTFSSRTMGTLGFFTLYYILLLLVVKLYLLHGKANTYSLLSALNLIISL